MTTDNASQDANQPTVGERLRQAREIAGLSVAEVAAKQHLRPVIISAIESGDYRKIDSELFLKGYVRAYANHVGVDPESVVRQLDRELEPLREERQARVEANPLVNIERRKRRKRQIAKIVVTLLALAALFYAGTLYLASQEPPAGADTGEPMVGEESETDASQPAEPAPENDSVADDEPLVEPPLTVSQTTEDEGGNQDSAVADATGEAPVSADGAGDVDAVPPEGGTDSSAQEPLQTVTELEPVRADSGVEPSDDRADSDASGQAIAAPEDEDGRLVVEFSGDCWVEVQDSNGRTLVAELRRAGETLDVTGDGPLRVVLGAVSAVSELSYGGEPVDLSDRRARNNRLVLTVPD